MLDPFASPKRRLARANEKITNIKTEIDAFFDAKPYVQAVERNASGFDEHKMKLTRDLPDGITDLTYEAIEAIRSSLDQAAYAIAVACNSKRPDLIHFPIADNAADFEKVVRGRIKDFPPDILALFRSLKPYQGGNDLIWALNRVRRQAAHRLIVPVGTISEALVYEFSISRPLPLTIPAAARWDSAKNEIIP